MTKTAKIIVTASGTIFSKMHGGWHSLWAGYEAAPFSCVIERTLFSFHEWGIASRLAKANTRGSR